MARIEAITSDKGESDVPSIKPPPLSTVLKRAERNADTSCALDPVRRRKVPNSAVFDVLLVEAAPDNVALLSRRRMDNKLPCSGSSLPGKNRLRNMLVVLKVGASWSVPGRERPPPVAGLLSLGLLDRNPSSKNVRWLLFTEAGRERVAEDGADANEGLPLSAFWFCSVVVTPPVNGLLSWFLLDFNPSVRRSVFVEVVRGGVATSSLAFVFSTVVVTLSFPGTLLKKLDNTLSIFFAVSLLMACRDVLALLSKKEEGVLRGGSASSLADDELRQTASRGLILVISLPLLKCLGRLDCNIIYICTGG